MIMLIASIPPAFLHGVSAEQSSDYMVEIDAPGDGEILLSDDAFMSGSVHDRMGNLVRVEVRVDLGTWRNAILSDSNEDAYVNWWIHWPAHLSEGKHEVEVRATTALDDLAFAYVSAITPTVLGSAPTVSIDSIELGDGKILAHGRTSDDQGPPTLRWSWISEGEPLESGWILPNGIGPSSELTSPTSFRWDIAHSLVSPCVCALAVEAVDLDGLVGRNSSALIDWIPALGLEPTITWSHPYAGNWTDELDLELGIARWSNLSANGIVQVALEALNIRPTISDRCAATPPSDDVSWQNIDKNAKSIDLRTFDEGALLVALRVQEDDLTVWQSCRIILIDRTAPSITLDANSEVEESADGVLVTANVQDGNQSCPSTCSINWSVVSTTDATPQTYTISNSDRSILVSTYQSGTFRIRAIVVDEVGRSAHVLHTIKIENREPRISLTIGGVKLNSSDGIQFPHFLPVKVGVWNGSDTANDFPTLNVEWWLQNVSMSSEWDSQIDPMNLDGEAPLELRVRITDDDGASDEKIFLINLPSGNSALSSEEKVNSAYPISVFVSGMLVAGLVTLVLLHRKRRLPNWVEQRPKD